MAIYWFDQMKYCFDFLNKNRQCEFEISVANKLISIGIYTRHKCIFH